MIAIEIREPGEPDVLVPVERPKPAPDAGEVLIKVAAAGVNRPDVLQRRGGYAPPPGASDIPGLEVAGTIEALGPGVSDWQRRRSRVRARRRRRLRGVLRRRRRRSACRFRAAWTSSRPPRIPETFFTVWTNVFERGRLQPGESLLVHGGSSGIGTTAIQLAQARGRARVRDRGLGGEVRRVRAARRRARDQLSRRRLRRRRPRADRRTRRRRRSSTWSAATTSRATSRRWRSKAGWSRSPRCTASRPS